MNIDINTERKHRAASWFEELRNRICSEFEKIEHKIRLGHKYLKLLRMPGTQIVGRVAS